MRPQRRYYGKTVVITVPDAFDTIVKKEDSSHENVKCARRKKDLSEHASDSSNGQDNSTKGSSVGLFNYSSDTAPRKTATTKGKPKPLTDTNMRLRDRAPRFKLQCSYSEKENVPDFDSIENDDFCFEEEEKLNLKKCSTPISSSFKKSSRVSLYSQGKIEASPVPTDESKLDIFEDDHISASSISGELGDSNLIYQNMANITTRHLSKCRRKDTSFPLSDTSSVLWSDVGEGNSSERNAGAFSTNEFNKEEKDVPSLSFHEKFLNSSNTVGVTQTAEAQVLNLCNQTEAQEFSFCIPEGMMSQCVKIGEGVYGEVFRSVSRGQSVALKIIPIEGDFDVNDCPQKKFEEILPEIIIAKELSDLAKGKVNRTEHFCQVNRISCVRGEFPDPLLQQWDDYAKRKHSENDRPDVFSCDQLFIVFEFVNGGSALENFKFSNHREALSILRQVVFALAIAEEEMEFEHRDLHIGNVLVRPCEEESLTVKLRDREYKLPSEGVFATIIDFTISRLKKDGTAVFCDISTDDGLFEGTGDFQFDVYRDMRSENGNDWQTFCAHSNVLWVNYLCRKLLTTIRYKETGRSYRDAQKQLRQLLDSIVDFSSCKHLTEEASLWFS